MHDILKDFTSPHWWITVAIAGFLMNVLASYCVRWLDRTIPSLSARMRSWTGQRVAEFSRDVDRASKDFQTMTFLAARQANWQISSLQCYISGSIALFASANVGAYRWISFLLLLIGILFIIAGSGDFGRAMRCRAILDCVEKAWTDTNKAPKPAASAPVSSGTTDTASSISVTPSSNRRD